ncbi:MAG: major capsid protein [Porticoccaceae bacterium]|nr:major capsid protein [Porticoccaceae bacterium]
MSVLDVFNGNAFGVLALTDAINKQPFIPGRAGQVIDWNERGVATTSIMIEEIAGELRIIDPTPRGGPGVTLPKDKRNARILGIPHYQVDDAVYAEEVQGVRAFGQESQVQTIMGRVNERLLEHVQLHIDPTLEYQRIGAVKGIILNGNGTTLYNLFTEFGVSPPSVVGFSLPSGSTASTGAIRTKCTQVVRSIAAALGGIPYQRVYAFAGDNFWDAMIATKEVRETYLNQAEASQLRGNAAFETLDYGGITFENYRGGVGGTPFIDPDEVHFFPIGVPGLWRTVYAPADYEETVNTNGLPRYAKQYAMPNGKGRHLESQSNALNYCTRPNVLITGDIGSGT